MMADEKHVQIFTKADKDKTIHRIHLTRPIIDPHNYTDVIELLNSASADDTVHLLINTPGGQIRSAVAIINAIYQCKATVIGHLSGEIAIAGNIRAMACDDLVVNDYLEFLIHTYSGWVDGKGYEILGQAEFNQKNITKLMDKMYNGFLNSDELDKLHNGKTYIFDTDEVKKRWEVVQQMRHFKVQELEKKRNTDLLNGAIAKLEAGGYKVTKVKTKKE
jgi:ATP-dependent protease ClpP protease subunit